MMDNVWMSFAVQIPLVAAFMWFALELTKRFDEALARRDAALSDVAERLSELIAVMQVQGEKLERVDQKIEIARRGKNEPGEKA